MIAGWEIYESKWSLSEEFCRVTFRVLGFFSKLLSANKALSVPVIKQISYGYWSQIISESVMIYLFILFY